MTTKILKQSQTERLQELFNTARQRYLEAGGDPHHPPSGRKGDDFMSDPERQEAWSIIDAVFGLKKNKGDR